MREIPVGNSTGSDSFIQTSPLYVQLRQQPYREHAVTRTIQPPPTYHPQPLTFHVKRRRDTSQCKRHMTRLKMTQLQELFQKSVKQKFMVAKLVNMAIIANVVKGVKSVTLKTASAPNNQSFQSNPTMSHVINPFYMALYRPSALASFLTSFLSFVVLEIKCAEAKGKRKT